VLPLINSAHTHKVYEILFEFSKYCYPLIAVILQSIVQLTLEHIGMRNEVAILAMELWDTIGSEYIKRVNNEAVRIGEQGGIVRNFIEEHQEALLPEVMHAMIITNKADMDIPDLREIAVKALGTIVNCCGRSVVDKVTDGVSRVLRSLNPGERQASGLIFSTLCYYADRDYI
jgi:hypothetical protein